jgi:hypothetical protein
MATSGGILPLRGDRGRQAFSTSTGNCYVRSTSTPAARVRKYRSFPAEWRIEGRTKRFVSLFQIRRQHIFDPFHECADSARQIAPMCYDEGHGERPATKIGYDLHKRSTL